VSHRTAQVTLVLWLTVVWAGLWGSVTAANVLGGLAVAVVVVRALPLPSPGTPGVVDPGALLRFAARFVVDLLISTWQVAVLVLHPRGTLRQGVVAVPVPGASDALLTMLANAISLTPGTLTLDIDRATSTVYVHALDIGKGPEGVQQLRRDLHQQASAAVHAIGPTEARAALRSRGGLP
jgi:multicomponent Na+:H+ antiporter subunit E